MYASPELKALKASSENLGSRKTALQRRWFMALSTSELVTDIFSEPSAEGQSGVVPTPAPVPPTGFKSWLLGARLAGFPGHSSANLFPVAKQTHKS